MVLLLKLFTQPLKLEQVEFKLLKVKHMLFIVNDLVKEQYKINLV